MRRFLIDRRIPCSVINLTRYRTTDSDGVFYPSNAIGVVRRMVALRPTIIHLHVGNTLSTRLLALSAFATFFPGTRVLLTCHSGGFPRSAMGSLAVLRFLRRRILGWLDAIIVVNAEVATHLRREGVPNARLHLISPYACPPAPSSDPLPEPLGRFLRHHEPRLLTVSGLEPEYDLPLQIEALGHVRRCHPSAGLAIIGTGRREAEIRATIAKLPYSDHILVCGDLPHAVTLRALTESDVFLRTTHYDGDAISVREALDLGVPVIATDNGMRPSGVELVPVSDRRALARAVENIVARPKIHRAAPGPGTKNLQAIVDLYSEVVNPCLVPANEGVRADRAS